MFDIANYWDRRYARGRTSGAGSEGELAAAKAAHVRNIIDREQVSSIIDWGAGDGHVLGLIRPQVPYHGIDVSRIAVTRLQRMFPQHSFSLATNYRGNRADLALSLDVIFHLVNELDYEVYMQRLFGSAERLVLIHATDHDGGQTSRHVKWRHWTADVAQWFGLAGWQLVERPDDPTRLGFYLYRRG